MRPLVQELERRNNIEEEVKTLREENVVQLKEEVKARQGPERVWVELEGKWPAEEAEASLDSTDLKSMTGPLLPNNMIG